DYWLLDMSTSNFQNVSLRFDYRITSVSETQIGPSELLLEYAVDGGAFLSAGTTALTRNNNWNELTFDLAALGLDDTAEVQIRGTWSNDGVGSVSARLDHLQVTGDAIPEPASLALIGFGALLAIRRRRA